MLDLNALINSLVGRSERDKEEMREKRRAAEEADPRQREEQQARQKEEDERRAAAAAQQPAMDAVEKQRLRETPQALALWCSHSKQKTHWQRPCRN